MITTESTDMEKILYHVKLNKDICRTVGSFYEQAAMDGCNIKTFSDRYLESKFCRNRMECEYSSFWREDALTCLEFIYPEIGFPESIPNNKDKNIVFDPDVAYWIGYTYYQLYCETGIHGNILKEKVPFDKLILNYEAHHTLDEYYSTDKLCSYYGLHKNSLYRRYIDYLDTEFSVL